MEHLIEANFIPDQKSTGSLERMLTIIGDAGDTIFVNSSPKRGKLFFKFSAACESRTRGQSRSTALTHTR